jgi:MFS family permease
MKKIIKKSLPTIITTLLLLISVGYINTLIPLQIDNFTNKDNYMVGAASSCYYIGLLLGSFNIAPFIVRTGHIRAYVSFCAILVVVVLMHHITTNMWAWLFLRMVCGFCVSANYVVFESWLIDIAQPNQRGKLLAFYMFALYGGSAIGQLLISITPGLSTLPYVYAAMLVSLSMLPLTMSSIVAPKIESCDTISLKKLFKISHSGTAACLVSGFILASLFGIMPVYAERLGFDNDDVSIVMFALIFGGMAMQMPFGKLSDISDRRKIMSVITILMIINLIMIIILPKTWQIVSSLVFLYGGLSFALYPIGISLACDHIKGDNIPAITQGMLLVYGIGSIVGPFIASVAMKLDNEGFIYYHVAVCVIFLAVLSYRISKKSQKPEDHMHVFTPVVTTTPVSGGLDPRIDDK